MSDPSEARGTTLTAREILAKGVQQLDSLRDQPAVQARLQATIGTVDTELGLYRDAQPLLRRPCRRGGASSVRTIPTRWRRRMPWPTCTGSKGSIVRQNHCIATSWSDERALLGADHPDTLRANYDLASLYPKQMRWEEFDRLSRDTLARQHRVLGDNHPDTLDSLGNLSLLFRAGPV